MKLVKTKTLIKRQLAKEIKSSWWVGVFCLFTWMLYMQTAHSQSEEVFKLSTHLASLEAEKELALGLKQQLSSEIQSHQDPQFVEIVLMRKLGVVPEGSMKVQFHKPQAERLIQRGL